MASLASPSSQARSRTPVSEAYTSAGSEYEQSTTSRRSPYTTGTQSVHGSIFRAHQIQPRPAIPPTFLQSRRGPLSRVIPSVNWDGIDYKVQYLGSQPNPKRPPHLLHALQCEPTLFEEEYCNLRNLETVFLEDFGRYKSHKEHREAALRILRRRGPVRYQCPFCWTVSKPGRRADMVRHIYGQPARGNNRRRSECKKNRGNIYPDTNYGGVKNLEDPVAVIYQADLDMLPDEAAERFQDVPVVA